MPEMRADRRQGSAIGNHDDPQTLDDWLGDISDEDWNEGAAELAGQRREPGSGRRPRTADRAAERARLAGDPVHARPAPPAARSARLERRWAVAALAALVLLAIIGAAAALSLTDDADTPTQTTTQTSTATTTAQAETETEPPTTTPTTTTPETAPAFVLPEGTKLQLGESVGETDLVVSTDPELVADLQRALARAGFDPGTPDGTFGENTEQAVIAFQQANGLTPDGIVGPETAEALDAAAAGG